MTKRLRLVLVVLAVVAIVFGFEQYATREPKYRGKRLRDWIQEGFRVKNPNPAGAREAVLACGTNAISFYLKLLQTKPRPGFKDRFLDFLDRHNLPGFGLTHGDDSLLGTEVGAEGLAILGVAARPAVPTLLRLVLSGDYFQAARAGKVLARTGEGEVIISNLLSNPEVAKRARAALIAADYAVEGKAPLTPRTLAEIEDSARILIPALVPRANEMDPQVRSGSQLALARFARWPEIVVPILISKIADTNDNVVERSRFISYLTDVGPKAKAAVPTLLAAFNEPSSYLRWAAGSALVQIDDAAGAEVVNRFATLILDSNLNTLERLNLVGVLGTYGDKAAAATPALVELTRSRADKLPEAATIALAVINPEAAVEAGVSFADVFVSNKIPPPREIRVIRLSENREHQPKTSSGACSWQSSATIPKSAVKPAWP